jgi:hypothetical protein
MDGSGPAGTKPGRGGKGVIADSQLAVTAIGGIRKDVCE